MSTGKIARAIRESCSNDIVLRDMLMKLLEFQSKKNSSRSWYKDDYNKIIADYAKRCDKDEN